MFRRTIGPDAELVLLEERHAEEVFRQIDRNREYLRQWLPWLDGTRTADDTREFIDGARAQLEKGEGMVAGIWQEGELVGLVSFVRLDLTNRKALIGYWISADRQGRGLVTRACEALMDHGFGELGLNRIEIKAAAGNLRSQAVAVRLGMVREGVERQSEWLYDRFVDHVVFSMLRDEWSSRP
jgi:ribosomal-protein-serine acetyltransferase